MENRKVSESQKITLNTYNESLDKYISGTPQVVSGEFKDYFDYVCSLVDSNAEIFEIGSGTGRDADYIESKGLTVLRSDVAESFIQYLRDKGNEVLFFNALETKLDRTFDLILVAAVFLHFNEREFDIAMDNAVSHLKPGGYLAIVMKEGEGEGYSEHKMGKRFFKHWSAEELTEAFNERNLEVIDVRHTQENKWVHVVGRLAS